MLIIADIKYINLWYLCGVGRRGKRERCWLVLDGPADASWVEDLNTCLDDSRKLCLPSGETLPLPTHMAVIFEVLDLSQVCLLSSKQMIIFRFLMIRENAVTEWWLTDKVAHFIGSFSPLVFFILSWVYMTLCPCLLGNEVMMMINSRT